VAAAVAREKSDFAALELAEDEWVRWIAERRFYGVLPMGRLVNPAWNKARCRR